MPDGRALDFEAYCEQYERMIADEGGIDLQVLGIGSDGHIAFNEPGSSLGSRTRLKTLTEETVRDNARFFGSEKEVPRLAITMGVGTILESRQCLLLAAGDSKARAIRDTIEGPITAQVTASALQLHRDVIAILDEEAARLLERRDYYREVERAQAALQAGQLGKFGMTADCAAELTFAGARVRLQRATAWLELRARRRFDLPARRRPVELAGRLGRRLCFGCPACRHCRARLALSAGWLETARGRTRGSRRWPPGRAGPSCLAAGQRHLAGVEIEQAPWPSRGRR